MLAILIETDEAERLMWTERVRGPKAGMVIHQIMMERAHVWVWHENQGRGGQHHHHNHHQHQFHRQPDFTPRAVGTWATETKEAEFLPGLPAKPMCRQLMLYGGPCLRHGGS